MHAVTRGGQDGAPGERPLRSWLKVPDGCPISRAAGRGTQAFKTCKQPKRVTSDLIYTVHLLNQLFLYHLPCLNDHSSELGGSQRNHCNNEKEKEEGNLRGSPHSPPCYNLPTSFLCRQAEFGKLTMRSFFSYRSRIPLFQCPFLQGTPQGLRQELPGSNGGCTLQQGWCSEGQGAIPGVWAPPGEGGAWAWSGGKIDRAASRNMVSVDSTLISLL